MALGRGSHSTFFGFRVRDRETRQVSSAGFVRTSKKKRPSRRRKSLRFFSFSTLSFSLRKNCRLPALPLPSASVPLRPGYRTTPGRALRRRDSNRVPQRFALKRYILSMAYVPYTPPRSDMAPLPPYRAHGTPCPLPGAPPPLSMLGHIRGANAPRAAKNGPERDGSQVFIDHGIAVPVMPPCHQIQELLACKS